MRWQARFATAILLVVASGCVRVPPKNLSQDRFDYGQAIAESWKRQTLMNITRLRYGDAPTFMEVTSIINSYTTSGSVAGEVRIPESPAPNRLGLGAAASWSNSPTVTYQPLTGQKFTSGLLRPIPPSEVFRMIEGGWPAPAVFRIALRSINGLSNQAFGKGADPGFARFVEAMDRIQRSQALSIRVEEQKEGQAVIMALRDKSIPDSIRNDLRAVRELLGLKGDSPEYGVVFGSVPRNDLEIAVVTRSMLEIMLDLSFGVEVPPADLSEGRALASKAPPGEPPAEPLIVIHCGKSAPDDAFVAVPYRHRWFWIDDTDTLSKGRFTFLMILFSLAESGPATTAPLVTVSAGR